MNKLQKILSFVLALMLTVICLPLGTIAALDTDSDETKPPTEKTVNEDITEVRQMEAGAEPSTDMLFSVSPLSDSQGGSSGSETGDGGDGSGNAPSAGSSIMIAAGVTMQVVYHRYDECYNRYNSHGSVINTLQSSQAIPWNDTGKDQGATETTVFDSFTISPYTFVVKARWNGYPYVYHFPSENLQSDNCVFSWSGFTSYWFNYNNPGGKPSTYSHIVRNEENGSLAIEQFLARIILGNNYGAWDKLDVAAGETVETDTSLFAAVLKYLGASDLAIQNYLDAYYGNLSITQDGDTLIPTIIWSWVGMEDLSGTKRIYTIGDVADSGSENSSWLQTAYTSGAECNTGFGACTWKQTGSDTMICKMMLGGEHYPSHGTTIWTVEGSDNLFGTGLVNRIQTQVDATAEDGTNTFYYLRGYWTPYGAGSGSISLTKTNVAGTENLAGAEFTLYRNADCTVPVTAADYCSLSTSDVGYVSVSVRCTDDSGRADWTGLYPGTYFLMETKAPEGYQVNVDTSGRVEIQEVAVGKGETSLTLTNMESTKFITLEKSINASESCIAQLRENDLYSLAGAQYTISVDGTIMETLVTDADGNAVSSLQYNIGDVLTLRETVAPPGYLLDTTTYTYTVTGGDNVISVSDIPIFDPPFVLTKVDKDTTVPQGDSTFNGAVFKWEFFTNNDWSGTAARIWYFVTDANGRCIYSEDYLSSNYTSDQLYVSPAGVANLPLGTLKITEIENSLGYVVIPDSLYCTIAADSTSISGAKHIWTEDSIAVLKQIATGDWGVYEPIDTELFGSVSVDKYDAVTGQTPQGNATLAGATFEVINMSANPVKVGDEIFAPGDVICELTTDATGHAQMERVLPLGTYIIRECEPPEGYQLNSEWVKTFCVTTQQRDFYYSYEDGTGCPDEVITGSIQITKKILNAVDNTTAAEAGAKFSVTDVVGTVVEIITTGEDGLGTSKQLLYGTYTVTQLSGQAGTVLCQPWTVNIREHGEVYTYSKENPLWTASVALYKKEAGTDIPLVGAFELCKRAADGSVTVLETGTTSLDGKLTFTQRIAYTDGICNTATYFIREKVPPAGYVLDTKEYPVSCTSDQQTITITLENAPVVGRVSLQKLSSEGVLMQGVEFQLEYSLDEGKTWYAVTKRNSNATITAGSCAAAQLATDGRLLTNENGIAVFDGLRVYTASGKPIQYRLTEITTLDGYTLLPGPAWEGDLTVQTEGAEPYEISLRVINSPNFKLPGTGSHSFATMSAAIALCLLTCLGMVWYLKRKEN